MDNNNNTISLLALDHQSLSPRARPPPHFTPIDAMEFLSRSWTASALEAVSKTPAALVGPILEDAMGELEEDEEEEVVAGNTFTFGSSATSQLVLERIMSHSVSHSFFLFATFFSPSFSSLKFKLR